MFLKELINPLTANDLYISQLILLQRL